MATTRTRKATVPAEATAPVEEVTAKVEPAKKSTAKAQPTKWERVDQADCKHERTPKGRAACRAERRK